jgi:hypothetical protein
MQADGNLVLYTPGGKAVWASSTSGSPGSYLIAQNDGNVVIYRPTATQFGPPTPFNESASEPEQALFSALLCGFSWVRMFL